MRALRAVELEFGGIFRGIFGCSIGTRVCDFCGSAVPRGEDKVEVCESDGCGNRGKDITG